MITLGGAEWNYAYNIAGLLSSITDPRGNTVLHAAFVNTKVAALAIQQEQYSFTDVGGATLVENSLHQQAIFWPHQSGLTESIQDWSGRTSRILFNDDLSVRTLLVDDEPVLSLVHDGRGRVRRAETRVDGITNIFRYQYNGTKLTRVSRGNAEIARYNYHRNDQLSSAVDRYGTRTYEYNTDGRVERLVHDGEAVDIATNEQGIITRVGDPLTPLVQLDLDDHDQVRSVKSFHGGREYLATFDYRSSGFRGSGSYGQEMEVVFAYDPVGNLEQIDFEHYSGYSETDRYTIGTFNELEKIFADTGSDLSVDYDNLGNPSTAELGGRVATFEYDALSRLKAASLDGQQLFEIEYGALDPDIVESADWKTNRTFVAAPLVSPVYGDTEALIYARPIASPYGFVRFSASMASFVVDDAHALYVAPDAVRRASMKRRMLPIDGQEIEAQALGFDKPSNNLFLPPEYFSTNCYVCVAAVTDSEVILNGVSAPQTVEVGVPVDIEVVGTGTCHWQGYPDDEGPQWPPPVNEPYVPPPAYFQHTMNLGDGTTIQGASGIGVDVHFRYAYPSPGTFVANDSIRCTCLGFWTLSTAQESVTAVQCNEAYRVAFHADGFITNNTLPIMNTGSIVSADIKVKVGPGADFDAFETGVQSFWNKSFAPFVLSFGFEEADLMYFGPAIEYDVAFYPPSDPELGNAQQGGVEMEVAFGEDPKVVAHEFGHILGFPNSYVPVEGGGRDLACFEEDLMSTAGSGKDVHRYHAIVLEAKY